jgi:hypothetical protein
LLNDPRINASFFGQMVGQYHEPIVTDHIAIYHNHFSTLCDAVYSLSYDSIVKLFNTLSLSCVLIFVGFSQI